MLKTHACGELSTGHVGQSVVLAGWVHRRRDHGRLIFIDLRDREGIVQVTFNPQNAAEAHEVAAGLRNEYVVRVEGEVVRRPRGTENPNLATGEVEVVARRAEVLSASQTPPFYINEPVEVDENLRLRYRYLDLRRPEMQRSIILRHRVVKFIRDFLDAQGFLEIETPILINSTPEGARDYLVPSRLYAGRFYALPQSPQQLKQLLMVAGFEKYFQIARCFRDEDQRADRQPEHTQLDLEMSFVSAEDVMEVVEELFTEMVREVMPEKRVISPFPRITYHEALSRYGTDKPDLRYALELGDVSDLVAQSSFAVFRNAVASGGQVRGFVAPGCAGYSRRELEELSALATDHGAAGLVTLALGPKEGARSLADLEAEDIRSAAMRFLSLDTVRQIAERLGGSPGDLILMVAGPAQTVNGALSQLRAEMARRLELADPDLLAFIWVVGFPLFEWNDDEGRWEPMHHLFTAPVEEDIPLVEKEPGKVRSQHYDIVCNGVELASGSIRIHDRGLQQKVLRVLGYSDEEATDRFGHLLEAFEYGAPPHGGIAPGIDRLVMLLAGKQTIREVMAFPKTQSATDPMTGAPSEVTDEQLRELHLSLRGD